nr:uncharacterized protein LOC105470447 [Macaca nemestrina]
MLGAAKCVIQRLIPCVWRSSPSLKTNVGHLPAKVAQSEGPRRDSWAFLNYFGTPTVPRPAMFHPHSCPQWCAWSLLPSPLKRRAQDSQGTCPRPHIRKGWSQNGALDAGYTKRQWCDHLYKWNCGPRPAAARLDAGLPSGALVGEHGRPKSQHGKR